MLMGHDLAWWGVALGVVSLVLMFPAAIFANIATPKIQNWWAQRSVAALRARIGELEEELADYEQHYELISAAEDFALLGIDIIIGLIVIFMEMVPVLAMVGLGSVWDRSKGNLFWTGVEWGVACGMWAAIVWVSRIMKKSYLDDLRAYRRPRSARARAYIRQSTEKLRVRLGRMGA